MVKSKSKSSSKKESTVKKKISKSAAKNQILKKKISVKKLKKKTVNPKLTGKKTGINVKVKKLKLVSVKTILNPKSEKKTVLLKVEVAGNKKIKKYKPNKKVRYSLSELKHFRNIILQERKAILESAKANMDALVDKDSGEYKGDNLTYSSHMAEQGTDEMEREKNYLFVQRDEKYLGYLQDALMRIDQGTYGICVDCRDVPKNLCRTCPLIVKERLELVPITQHCIECKNLRG